MPKPPMDMLGQKIGRLTVVKKLGKRPNGGGQEWLCHYESSLSRIANHSCMLKEVQI